MYRTKHIVDGIKPKELKNMGAVNSTIITSKDVSSIINEVTIQTLTSCETGTDSNQNVNIVADNNSTISKILITQATEAGLKCFSKTENQLDVLNQIVAKVAAKANASSNFLLGIGINTSVVSTSLVQATVNKHMISNVTKCASSNSINQSIGITAKDYSSIYDVTLSQDANVATECMFGTSNIDALSTKIASDINAEATAQSGGLSKTITTALAVFLILIAAALLFKIVFGAIKKRSNAQIDTSDDKASIDQ